LLGNINAKFPEGADGVRAGRLAFKGADSSRNRGYVIAAPCGVAEKALSHRTTTNISGANEQNCSHSSDKPV
jgi:hypothetical protein